MSLIDASFRKIGKNALKDRILDVGAVDSKRPLIASIMPIIADVVNILQVVDVKAMFLALEGTEDQALFSKMLHLEMVPGFYFQMSSFMHESSHRLYIVESSHDSEQAEALRFLCINADVDAKLPKDYWEQDCRYLIENLEYEVAKQVVESDNLKLDVNMGIAYNDKSNFHLAVERGCMALVLAMLQHRDVDINHCNAYGYTALHYAVVYDHPDLVFTLLDYGADPNRNVRSTRDTPLHLAARHRESDCMLPLLMHKGIAINETNRLNQTPLDKAMIYQNISNTQGPFTAKLSYDRLFPPNTNLHRRGIKLHKANAQNNSILDFARYFRRIFSVRRPLHAPDDGLNLKEKHVVAEDNSDLALLEALAEAAADIDKEDDLIIPTTSSPCLSPHKLSTINEQEEEEEMEKTSRPLVTLKIVKERKILRSTVDQLLSRGARTHSETKSM